MSTHSSGENKATATTSQADNPYSAKAKIITEGKKNGTITEEDSAENESME